MCNLEKIENLIYNIRGKEVMLDSDLARLYNCKNGTKTINQAVSRHPERFPMDFYFQLTIEEYYNLKSQSGTSSFDKHGGVRKMPFVFTEQGVAMLATILKTPIATEMMYLIEKGFIKIKIGEILFFLFIRGEFYVFLANIIYRRVYVQLRRNKKINIQY